MSVKQPWDNSWKTRYRTRIKGCSGVVVLITKNLKQADRAIWEIKCAKEEGIPLLGVYLKGTSAKDVPAEMMGIRKVTWSWDNVRDFIEKV